MKRKKTKTTTAQRIKRFIRALKNNEWVDVLQEAAPIARPALVLVIMAVFFFGPEEIINKALLLVVLDKFSPWVKGITESIDKPNTQIEGKQDIKKESGP